MSDELIRKIRSQKWTRDYKEGVAELNRLISLAQLAKIFKSESAKMKHPPLIELNWERQETAAAVMAGIGRCLEKVA